MPSLTRNRLEALYRKYNRRRYVHPDPLEFLYAYPDVRDREVAALVASSLAYGRVGQILVGVSRVLGVMGPSPARYLSRTPLSRMRRELSGFVHRFATGDRVAGMLDGARRVAAAHGSLGDAFAAGMVPGETVQPALCRFSDALIRSARIDPGHLIPRAEKGSGCKRLNLFLRWMVRSDAVDPGGWEAVVSASALIVPLDTHMHRFALAAGLTRRRQADMRCALEITERFGRIVPEDPVRYDFALTRLGIRADADFSEFFEH